MDLCFDSFHYFRAMYSNKKIIIIALIILAAAFSRLIPHPLNFAPLGAMALFGAAYFGRKGLGLLMTMLAWFASDLILNNFVYPSTAGEFVIYTQGAFYIYAPIVIIYAGGTLLLQRVTLPRVILGSLAASVVFFAISNFGVWMSGMMYPISLDGLWACYAAALPFFKNTLAGDLFFSAVLFIAYERIFRSRLQPAFNRNKAK